MTVVGRWQRAQACTAGVAPCATIRGIGGCSCGYQSGGLNKSSIWAWVYCRALPGICLSAMLSGGSGFGEGG